MKFTLFKKIFKKAERIYFSAKGNKCYLTDGFATLQFNEDLKDKIFETIGFVFAGSELKKFVILKENEKTKIFESTTSILDLYFKGVNTISAQYTGLILDGIDKKAMIFDADGLLGFNANYVNMAIQLTDTVINPCYSKDFNAL